MRTHAPEVRRTGRPRGPGLVYGALALALIVVVGVIALTTRQPPPPTIAEFAPQAVEQIRDAPSEQTSEFGSGQGGATSGEAATPAPAAARTPKPAAGSVVVPRVRRCVGNPPRQIEDPQSPPCVPYWEGKDPGATAQGVYDDEIRIYAATGEGASQIYDQLATFFNKRFEFYGRRIVMVPGRSDIGQPGQAEQQAEAKKAASLGVFASTFYRNSDGYHYREEAARQKIISVGIYQPNEHRYLASKAPYMWQYALEAERIFANIGEWACGRLADGPAAHAGTGTRGLERAFAIVVQPYFTEDQTDAGALKEELARCDVEPVYEVRNPVQGATGQPSPAAVDPVSANNAILRIRDEGATSIFCLCNLFAVGALMKGASNQAYFPEWLLSSYGAMDINNSYTVGAAPPEQLEHAFGLAFIPRQVRAEHEPYRWALREVDPNGTYAYDTVTAVSSNEQYRAMLLLASGIQLAGPHLTAETFERGLHRAMFPNPPHPIQAGAAGFLGGRYGMTQDAAEFWWSNTEPGPYEGDDPGTLCYLDGGRRYAKGDWPRGSGAFFEGSCDSGR